MEDLMTVLQNFGFPVAVCGVLMYYIRELNKNFSEQLTRIMEQHKNESDKMVQAINSNTLVMQKLVDKLGEENV